MPRPAPFTPTDEQVFAVDSFIGGDNLVVKALAGSGKTSTLRLMAEEAQRRGCRGRYLVFNRSICNDAKGSFPPSCRVSTVHSLARSSHGQAFAHRLDSARMRSDQIARMIGIRSPIVLDVGGARRSLNTGYLAGLVMAAATTFANSDRLEPSRRDFAYIDGIDLAGAGKRAYDNNDPVAQELEPALRVAWADLTNPGGLLPFRHDVYLKLFELSRPRIPADYLFLDEAQDATKVMLSILRQQTETQVVCVGDDFQTIYQWRGSVNAMDEVPGGAEAWLTQCQPPGTMVRVPLHTSRAGVTGSRKTEWNQVPIESLREGDKVVSWNARRSERQGLAVDGSAITSVDVRQYEGPLVVASAGGAVSRYALNHECVAVLGSRLDEGDYVVYLMRRGSHYRVGRCPWRYQNGIAPVRRAVREEADDLWVLSVHETEAGSALHEAWSCVEFGLPGVSFVDDPQYKMSLEAFWAKVGDRGQQ
jgi:hypothetical protein